MENASKALLFAAGILIAIILISVAVFVVQQGTEFTKNAGDTLGSLSTSTFNAKFKTYLGKQYGSNVKQLVDVVNTHNAGSEPEQQITISGEGIDGTGAPTNYKFTGKTAKNYQVDPVMDGTAITGITVGLPASGT